MQHWQNRKKHNHFYRILFSFSMISIIVVSFPLGFSAAGCSNEESTAYETSCESSSASCPETCPPNETCLTTCTDASTASESIYFTTEYRDLSPVDLLASYVAQLSSEIQQADGNVPSPDQVLIPDKRNTGLKENTVLESFPESGYIGMIRNEEQNNGKLPLFLTVKQNEFYNINGYKNKDCASKVIIDGYNFGDAKLYTTHDEMFSSQLTLIFRNCKFNRIQSFPGSQLWIVLDHCQVEGNIAGNNMIIQNSYLHSYNCDALNPVRNVVVKDSYIADLFRDASADGHHIDGIHIFGDRYGGISENLIFDNVRFSLPQISYEGSASYVNSAIITGLKFSEGRNFLFRNLIIDSGGRWFPIYNTGGEAVLYKNVQVANGYRSIFYPNYINPNAAVQNVAFSDGLYVSSVWKDAENRTHFLCSNNNMQTEKILNVKTDLKDFTFYVERHPTPAELAENPVYKTYRFEDLPYDIEFVIEENIQSAVFFDGEKQIRSVIF